MPKMALRPCLALALFGLVACSDDTKSAPFDAPDAAPDAGNDGGSDVSEDTTEPLAVPEFGTDETRLIAGMASSEHGLMRPTDLAFNPDDPTTLWVTSQANDAMLLVFDAGTDAQTEELRQDMARNHFMEEVTSLAFGAPGTFATCQESRNTYDGQAPPDDFMGPVLWPSDLEVFARVNQDPFGALAGSHLDMLHESPLCMGIAHYRDNAYFVFDGHNGNLAYYDFRTDHGPGADYHGDGIIFRYPEIELTRVVGVPSHMEYHAQSDRLFIADTGGSRVLWVDVSSGERGRELPWTGEFVADYAEYTGMEWGVFADDLLRPSGLTIHDGRLFIGDHGTGEIIAYDLATGDELDRLDTLSDELTGVAVGPDGMIWFIDSAYDEVLRVLP